MNCLKEQRPECLKICSYLSNIVPCLRQEPQTLWFGWSRWLHLFWVCQNQPSRTCLPGILVLLSNTAAVCEQSQWQCPGEILVTQLCLKKCNERKKMMMSREEEYFKKDCWFICLWRLFVSFSYLDSFACICDCIYACMYIHRYKSIFKFTQKLKKNAKSLKADFYLWDF